MTKILSWAANPLLMFSLFLAFAQPRFASAGFAPASVRQIMPLDRNWLFVRADAADGGAVQADTDTWRRVDLPHSFNAQDIEKGGDYYRGPVWYRREVRVTKIAPGSRTYIEFDGVALAADVWLNGHKIGRHEGGYARFRFDLTPHLKIGQNLLAVRVDNGHLPDVAPLGGDFTLFGGIYRPVRLVTTSDLHFDMLDDGGPGVYLSEQGVSAQIAGLNWAARITNDTSSDASAALTVTLYDADHRAVVSRSQSLKVAAHTTLPVSLSESLKNPHLWDGVRNPYLYTAVATLSTGGQGRTADRLIIPVGLRDIRFDADKGLLLNGHPYNVHGVDIHQSMRPGVGPAVPDSAIDADFQMLGDMGVTGLRLAHYQHPQRDYQISDQKGYLVWTEVPMVGEVIDTPAFVANAKQQLRELIRQNENHPSVMVWGIGNEIYNSTPASNALLDSLQTLAHAEDPTRPTTYANCCGPVTQDHASHSDVLGSNVYFGWYGGEFGDLAGWGRQAHALRPTTPQAISEYGAGASIFDQEDPPLRPKPASHWHPEQYQALYHEAAWRQIRDDMPWLWGRFVWVGFDFPSAGRNEGDHVGFNDKGLITFDRKVKKDAYFWYQANWTTKPMLYITSRRDTVRHQTQVEVKIYSNQSTARLSVNGVDQGEQPVADHIARWSVSLRPGKNLIEASGGPDLKDSVVWLCQPSKLGNGN